VIVASGPNSADPHHEVSDRVIQDSDIVVVDIGGAVPSGYNSDSTRTHAVGTPDPETARRIAVLVRASRPPSTRCAGVTAEQVDAAARDVLAARGSGEAFLHRTGHGIGVTTHEEPYIAPGNALPCVRAWRSASSPGSTSPGLGLPHRGHRGRHRRRCTNLNTTPHELTPALD
jgi:Xaa-Pro aminopeptidase